MVLPTTHIIRKTNIIGKKIGKEYIVIDIENEKMYRLNHSAQAIWRITSKNTIFSQLIEIFCKEFDVSQEDAFRDINKFIKLHKDLFVITK